MLRALTAAALTLLAVLGLVGGVAEAHSGKQSYLYVSVFDDGVDGRVEMPALDLSAALDIDIPSDVAGARAALGELTPTIREYAIANTSLGDEAGPWDIDYAERLTILPTENGPYVILRFAVDEPFDTAPTSFVAEFSVIIESNPEKDALLIIEDDWASATFDNGSNPLLGFSVGATEQTVPLGGSSTLESMAAIRGIGTDAVRNGIDLLLIVAAISLVALTARSTNGRLPGAAGTARRVALLLATLAITATPVLWLVGLGGISPSSRAIGIAVALALGAAAIVAITANVRTLPPAALTATAAASGVLLGAGLSELFIGAGLDRRRPVASVIAFEVGALAAGLFILACIAGPILLLRGTRLATPVGLVLGVAMLAYAMAWLGERGLDAAWPIEEVANPLRVWPRNLWFVAAAIGAAALWRRFDSVPEHTAENASSEETTTS